MHQVSLSSFIVRIIQNYGVTYMYTACTWILDPWLNNTHTRSSDNQLCTGVSNLKCDVHRGKMTIISQAVTLRYAAIGLMTCDVNHQQKNIKKDNIIPQVSYSFRLQYHQCNQCDRALSNAWYRVVHLWQLLCTDCNGTPLPPFFCVRRRPTSPTANSARHFRPAYVLLRREPEYASNQPTTHWRKNIS